jgi:hypothetical protein
MGPNAYLEALSLQTDYLYYHVLTKVSLKCLKMYFFLFGGVGLNPH